MRSTDLALLRLREQLTKGHALDNAERVATFHKTTLLELFSSAEPTLARRDLVQALRRAKIIIPHIADWLSADANEMIMLLRTDGKQHKRLLAALSPSM